MKFDFMKFDIVDFYPSISEDLLKRSMEFATSYTSGSDETINIIMHCRHSILFTNDGTWTKKDNPHFDVAMGYFDGAKICELVGLCMFYMLQHLSAIFGEKNSVGLYRNDGLAILQNIPGPEAERIRKKVIKVFEDHGLQLTTESSLIQTDFLDITFHIT